MTVFPDGNTFPRGGILQGGTEPLQGLGKQQDANYAGTLFLALQENLHLRPLPHSSQFKEGRRESLGP